MLGKRRTRPTPAEMTESAKESVEGILRAKLSVSGDDTMGYTLKVVEEGGFESEIAHAKTRMGIIGQMYAIIKACTYLKHRGVR